MSLIINPFFNAAAGVTPATFNPLRWYDAAFYSLADGASITNAMPWDDQSVNNDNATPTVGFEPTFRTNIFGALPAVRLLTPSHFAFDAGDLALPADFTIISVHRAYGDSIWVSRSGINRQFRITRAGANVYSYTSVTEIISGTLATAATDAKMSTWRRNDVATQIDFFENTTIFVGVGTANSVVAVNQIGIIDGGPLNIDIGEVVIYDTLLTDQNIQDLYDDYFQPKFGLP